MGTDQVSAIFGHSTLFICPLDYLLHSVYLSLLSFTFEVGHFVAFSILLKIFDISSFFYLSEYLRKSVNVATTAMERFDKDENNGLTYDENSEVRLIKALKGCDQTGTQVRGFLSCNCSFWRSCRIHTVFYLIQVEF